VENEQKHRNLKHLNFQKFVLIKNSSVLSGQKYQSSKTR
jgi:hypothetical protein